jgi:Pyridoxamine 5'-phosphate oxidase
MSSLADTAPAFRDMAHQIVWCTVATVSPSGKPATRVLHPIWEWDGTSLTGWIATSPTSPKAGHLSANPVVSLTYWAPNQDTCSATCETAWDDSAELRVAAWDRFKNAPAPVGYDPAIIPTWSSPDSPDFGVLRLAPTQLRLMPGTFMMQGIGELLTWHR